MATGGAPGRPGKFAHPVRRARPRRPRLGAGGFFLPATMDASSSAVSTRPTAHGGSRAAEVRSSRRPSS
jgi:hypothetical protein